MPIMPIASSGGIPEQDVRHGSRAADEDRAQQARRPHHHGDSQPVGERLNSGMSESGECSLVM